MVSVGKLKAGQARYYLDQAETHPNAASALASGAEDYYVDQDGETVEFGTIYEGWFGNDRLPARYGDWRQVVTEWDYRTDPKCIEAT